MTAVTVFLCIFPMLSEDVWQEWGEDLIQIHSQFPSAFSFFTPPHTTLTHKKLLTLIGVEQRQWLHLWQ